MRPKLGTPEDPARFSQRTGDRSARCFPNLTSQVLYGGLLKTPCAMDGTISSGKKNPVSGNSGTLAQEIMNGYAYRRGVLPTPTAQDFKLRGPNSHQQGLPEFIRGLLPTPTAGEGTKWARTYNPKSQMGKGLSVLAVNNMLPTPTTMDFMPPKSDKAWEREMTVTRPGRSKPSNLRDVPARMPELILPPKAYAETDNTLLPTPEASNYKNGHRTVSPRIERKMAQGWAVGLNDLATLSLLPTPVVCLDGIYADKNPGKRHSKSIATLAYEAGGKTSQLNPLFVEEMMGFPCGWILLPFLKASILQHEPFPSTDGGQNP